MDIYQVEILYLDEREIKTNLWTSYGVFPSGRECTIEGHLRVCRSMLQTDIWFYLPLIVAIITRGGRERGGRNRVL